MSHLGAVRPVGRRWIYKLSAMHAHSYTAERLALVGDAAHGIHPDRRAGAESRAYATRSPWAPCCATAVAAGAGTPERAGAAGPLPGGAPAGQPRHAGRHPRAGPAVLHRQPGLVRVGARSGYRRRATAAPPQAGCSCGRRWGPEFRGRRPWPTPRSCLEQTCNPRRPHGAAAETRDPGRRREIRCVLRVERHGQAQLGRRRRTGVGSTEGMGICHAYAPDGRCISLLKILLTNSCVFDCLYCINRRSSNVRRARFTVEEVVTLTLGFYRRNCIEGLFLSSGIIKDPDYTMEQVVRVARILREEHGFRGYIHLKTIPDADPALLLEAGSLRRPAVDQCRAADREQPGRASAREGPARHPPLHGPYPHADRRGEGRAQALRPRRAEHPGDHRRRRRATTGRSWR